VLTPGTDPGAAEDATFSRYEPETGFGTALFDARNGFNEINRYLMLWKLGLGLGLVRVRVRGVLPEAFPASRSLVQTYVQKKITGTNSTH